MCAKMVERAGARSDMLSPLSLDELIMQRDMSCERLGSLGDTLIFCNQSQHPSTCAQLQNQTDGHLLRD